MNTLKNFIYFFMLILILFVIKIVIINISKVKYTIINVVLMQQNTREFIKLYVYKYKKD